MTRSYADAFLQAILQDPNDDTPRLVYADWLEEQGDSVSAARAEFIRLQCTLGGKRLPPRRRAELEKREQLLLEQYGHEWVHPIRRLVCAWKFHRGFIDDVTVPADKFVDRAARLFRRAPIQRLHLQPRMRFSDEPGSMAILIDNEHLLCLRCLDLCGNLLTSREVRVLTVSERLTNLTALDLSRNRIGDGGIRALAGSPLLGQLEYLNLCGNDIGAGGLRVLTHALEELARSPEGLRLQLLDLSHDNLSAAGQRVIADSSLLRRVVCR